MKSRERISLSISEDVERFRALLQAINDDRTIYARFLEQTDETMKDAGIDLRQYATEEHPLEKLAGEARRLVEKIVVGDWESHFDPISKYLESKEATESETHSGVDTNWDHGSHSDINYSPSTSSDPGRSSESNSKSSYHRETHTQWNSLPDSEWYSKINERLVGPMISPEIMGVIVDKVEATLQKAAGVR